MQKDDNSGHRQRLRRRLAKSGLDSFHDYEAVELLLTYVIARRDVKPLAKALISKFGSFAGVLDADEKELQSVSGIGESAALFFRLLREGCSRYLAGRMEKKDVVSNPRQVIDFCRFHIGSRKSEYFMIIYLDPQNQVVEWLAEEGEENFVAVYPRKVASRALKNHATSIIAVHNHPSGKCNPSDNDIKVNDGLRKAASTINVKLIDHIIVTKKSYFSFAAHKLL